MATLLHYGMMTSPFPLLASDPGSKLNQAKLTLVATNGTGSDVTLQGVIVQIPVGSGATELTSDATNIGVVPAPKWTLAATNYPQGFVQYIFHPMAGGGTVASNSSLSFVFNDVLINTAAGAVTVEITEGSNNCVPPGCPTANLTVQKWPPDWGAVSLWTVPDPPIVPYNASVTLNWSGPAGATYTIDYYTPQAGPVHVPGTGQPPLASQGQYPGSTDPPLQLTENTTFYLSVAERISNQSYQSQQQVTATVETPKPKITSFTGTVDVTGGQVRLHLSWTAKNASYCTISGNPNQVQTSYSDYVVDPTPSAPMQNAYVLTAYDAQGLSDSATIRIGWKAAAPTPLAFQPWTLAVSRNGNLAYVGNSSADGNGIVYVYDTTSNPARQVAKSPRIGDRTVWSGASTDGSRLYVTNATQLVTFDIAGGSLSQIGSPVTVDFSSVSVAALPDDSRLYVLGSFDGTVQVVAGMATPVSAIGSPYKTVPGSPFQTLFIAVTPDNSRAFVACNNNNQIAVYDAANFQPIGTWAAPISGGGGFVVSADGKRLYASMGTLLLPLDAQATSFTMVGLPATIPGSSRLVMSPDRTRVFAVGYNQIVPVDITSHNLTAGATIQGGFQAITAFAVSPDGSRLFAVDGQAHTLTVLTPTITGGIGN